MVTTTATPFAGYGAMLNAYVQLMLGNAIASLPGGSAFAVVFERGASDSLSGVVDACAYTVAFDAAHTPDLAQGHELVIDGIAYTVSSGVQPDASGWVSLTVYPKGAATCFP